LKLLPLNFREYVKKPLKQQYMRKKSLRQVSARRATSPASRKKKKSPKCDDQSQWSRKRLGIKTRKGIMNRES